jgi:hypothetical protein
VRFDLDWQPAEPQNAFLVLSADPSITLHTADRDSIGTIYFNYREPAPNEQFTEQFRHWKQVLQHHGLCFRLTGPTDVYAPEHVVGGYARPYGGPQLWLSESLMVDPEPWLQLACDSPQTIGELSLIFDDDLDEDLINLHHHRTPYEVLPSLVRDYRVQAWMDGDWRDIAEGRDNRRRRCGHRLGQPVTTDRIRLLVTATNGAPEARVVAVRAYR